MKYSKDTAYAVGRNGFFQNLSGVEILSHSDAILLTPIGKSGTVLNAGFSIPLDDVPELITRLTKVLNRKSKWQ